MKEKMIKTLIESKKNEKREMRKKLIKNMGKHS